MTTANFKTIATEKLNKSSISDLIIEVKKLKNDFSDAAMLISESILDILIEKMSETEFVELCNEL